MSRNWYKLRKIPKISKEELCGQWWRVHSRARRRSVTSGKKSSSTSTFSPPFCPRTMSYKPKSSSTTVSFRHSFSASICRVCVCFYIICVDFFAYFSVIGRCAACGIEAASTDVCPGAGKVGAGVSEGNCPLYPQSDPTPCCFFWRTGLIFNFQFSFYFFLGRTRVAVHIHIASRIVRLYWVFILYW